MMAKRGTFSHIQRTISQLSEMVELFGTLYLSEGLEKVVAQICFSKSIYMWRSQEKNLGQKVNVKFFTTGL